MYIRKVDALGSSTTIFYILVYEPPFCESGFIILARFLNHQQCGPGMPSGTCLGKLLPPEIWQIVTKNDGSGGRCIDLLLQTRFPFGAPQFVTVQAGFKTAIPDTDWKLTSKTRHLGSIWKREPGSQGSLVRKLQVTVFMEYDKGYDIWPSPKGRKIISTKKRVKSWVPHLDSSSAIGSFFKKTSTVKPTGGNGLPALSFHMGMVIFSTSSKTKD